MEKDELEKLAEHYSKYYENQNAKKECPECDSLQTYFYKQIFICSACGDRERVNTKKAKEIISRLAVILIFIFLCISFLFI